MACSPVPAIARLAAADEDTVRDVIHAFNEKGLAALHPRHAGAASTVDPRAISSVTTRPHADAALGKVVDEVEDLAQNWVPVMTTARPGRAPTRPLALPGAGGWPSETPSQMGAALLE